MTEIVEQKIVSGCKNPFRTFYIAVMHYGVWLLIFLRKEQMQMKLVLAEKPSVAQSIAKVLGAAKREDGYLEGNGYVVSWCVGHLVELAQPEVYDAKYSKWAYRNLLSSYILPVFGSKQLRDITHEFIETQCNFFLVSGGLKENGLSSKTVSDILSLIRNVLQFATRNGKAISCDARSIQIKRQTKEMRVLSRAEQEKLCQYLYSNLDSCNIGILVCLFTGLRVGEICALRWEDVSFSDYTIHVHQTLQRIQDRTNSEYKTRIVVTTPKSACSIRTIPVPHGLMTILTAHKASSTGYILTNSDQNPLEPRTMQNHFKKVLKNSGITSANYHSLRHTFATRCIELGFDVKSLSEILGHASVNITMNRYVHPSMDLKRENMQRLSDLLAVK